MPFDNVKEFKESDLYKRLPKDIKGGSTSRLSRFLTIFNGLIARLTRNGAEESEAEMRAVPIAITAARKVAMAPVGRKAEDTEHVFALMTPELLHSGAGSPEPLMDNVSTDLVFPDLESLNDVIAGMPFNFNHDPNDPQGVIRRVVAREDLPEEVREKVDPDVKVVVTGSFFDDVPDEDRHATISPEWSEFAMSDGTSLAIPTSFAITANPANDPMFGIKMVAAGKPYKDANPSRQSTTMSDSEPTVESLQASLDESVEEKTAAEKRAEAAEKELTGLKERLATVAGTPEDEPENFDAEGALNTIQEKTASLEKTVEELVSAGKQAKAEDFAKALADEGKIAEQAREKWASRHFADPEGTEELASTLEANKVGVRRESRAAESIGISEDDEVEKYLAEMKEVF